MNQNGGPQRTRVLVTGGLLLALALVAFAVSSALGGRHHGGFATAEMRPVGHAQFHPAAGRMGHGGFGLGWARGGAGGTITQISGSTLTLRTEAGTETVNTSGTTRFMRNRQTIALSDLKIGDVVHVVPDASSAKPATPGTGTGTVTASRVVVVEPALGGRVTAIDGSTLSLVGRDGRELTVTLTDATRYFNGAQSADRAAVTVGSRILAMGTQDSLTHLTASTVTVLPARAPGAGPMWRGFGGGPGHPAKPGDFSPRGFGASRGYALATTSRTSTPRSVTGGRGCSFPASVLADSSSW